MTTMHPPTPKAPWHRRQLAPVALALVALLLVVHASAADAASWSPSTLPDPSKDPVACGRPPSMATSALCDPDRILSPSGANVIEGLLAAIRAAAPPYASSPCASKQERRGGTAGYQVAVAVVSRMADGGEEEDEKDPAVKARLFAKAIHDRWGVGRRKSGESGTCGDDGAVLFLAAEDRQAYVSTGAEAASKLPDATAAAVLRAMRPALRRGDYDTAVAQAAADLGLALAGRLDPSALPSGGGDGDESEDDDGWFMFAFFAAIFASVFGASWWSDRRTSHRLEQARAKLDAIRSEHAARRRRGMAGGDAQQGEQQQLLEYGASPTCPVCLELYEGEEEQAQAAAEEGEQQQQGGASKALRAAADAARAQQQQEERSGSTAAPARRRHKVLLGCGHAACQLCLEAWMGVQRRDTCPICRASATTAGGGGAAATAATTTAAASTSARDATTTTTTPSPPMWYPELAFRLGRLRALYPDVVSADLLARWERDALLGRFDSYSSSYGGFDGFDGYSTAALRRYEVRDPGRRREYERMGSGGGIGGGFGGGGGGGGSGGGGGGAGTSW